MIYVGGSLPKADGAGDENCLINPSLSVAKANPDLLGEEMSYWPSYASIAPRARLAYLRWLAEGRRSPTIGIGYVFLFFYGLERRVFIDQAEADYLLIADEVRRLLELYGANGSFKGYASRLLALLEVFVNRGETRPMLRYDLRNGFELPLDVRFYLGRKINDDKALDAEDALIWVLASADSFPRTPVSRCFDEFQDLWKVRFHEQWPVGLKVRRPHSDLLLTYQSASGSFRGSFSADGVPDIANVQAPVARLRDLMTACSDELDAYSRCLGRQPEARGTMQAVTLLPKALASTQHAARAADAKTKIHNLINGTASCAVSIEAVLQALDLPRQSTLVVVGPILDHLDLGFEPDRRFGALSSASADTLVLFPTNVQLRPINLDEFKAARTHVEIAILAAAADGRLDPAELSAIDQEISSLPGLTGPEQRRLAAYAQALARSVPKPQGILNKAGRLDARKRDNLVRAAMTAILADGRVTPEEVKYLERLYKAIGLPPEAVYTALHRGVGPSDEPVTVAEASPGSGTAIRKPEVSQKVGVSIDLARLGLVREQTAAVSTLLSGIFVEETSPDAIVPATGKTDEPARPPQFPGLNPAHTQLLTQVLEGRATTWSEFEDAARCLKLMPDGALETLNDWGFEHFEESILEAGDVLTASDQLLASYRTVKVPA